MTNQYNADQEDLLAEEDGRLLLLEDFRPESGNPCHRHEAGIFPRLRLVGDIAIFLLDLDQEMD